MNNCDREPCPDTCPDCGEVIDIDTNPFIWGPGRYKALCGCTHAESDYVDIHGDYHSSYKPATLGEVLAAKEGK